MTTKPGMVPRAARHDQAARLHSISDDPFIKLHYAVLRAMVS